MIETTKAKGDNGQQHKSIEQVLRKIENTHTQKKLIFTIKKGWNFFKDMRKDDLENLTLTGLEVNRSREQWLFLFRVWVNEWYIDKEWWWRAKSYSEQEKTGSCGEF